MSPANGEHTPLLPEHNKLPAEQKRASFSGAIFNVTTTIIGAGIMSIPATLKVLGIIPAVLLIVFVAWLVDVSVEFLMRYTHSGKATTYAGVMREAFGLVGFVAVQMAVIVTSLGCLIIYLIIIGDVLSGNGQEGTMQKWFGIHWWNSRAFTVLFVVIFVMFPLALFKRIESLKFSSAISVLLAVIFVGINSVMAIYAVIEGTTENPRFLPHLDDQTSFFDLFTAIPVIVAAYTFHFNVHPISLELGKSSDMSLVVKISLVICAVIYSTLGIFGYLLFGESIMGDILVNFDRSSDTKIGPLLTDIIRFTYVSHLILVFPVFNFALRANIDEFLFPKRTPLAKDTRRFLSLTVIILGLSYLLAITIPNIWYCFQFIGSTSSLSLSFIFPSAIVLRDVHSISTRRDRIMAAIMMILAVGTSAIAISTNIYNFIANKS